MTENEIFTDNPIGDIDVPKTFDQLGIFVLDGSGSMGDTTNNKVTKADAVNMALRGLFTRFHASSAKANFSFAVVTFDTQARVHTPITSADKIDDNENYDPRQLHGGGTNISTGLKEAKLLAEAFLNSETDLDIPRSVVIVVMSDGLCGSSKKTLSLADEIKPLPGTTICTTYFGSVGKPDPKAQELLKQISTDPIMGFKTVYDEETLRRFFIASVSSVSGVQIV